MSTTVANNLKDCCNFIYGFPFRRGLVGELEDADLHQLVDGEVLETAGLHPLDEVGRDFEDADLDELIERGLVAESANLPDLVGVDALDAEANELIGVGHRVAKRGETIDESR